ncbi:MAG: hypothetical protein HPY58_14265 [Firmicutes bacterium]|nr:hypothetical protein [Bacillota bacterium]
MQKNCFKKGRKKPRDRLVYLPKFSLILGAFLALLGVFLAAGYVLAASWGYKITVSDTPSTIDFTKTSAVVDTTLKLSGDEDLDGDGNFDDWDVLEAIVEEL